MRILIFAIPLFLFSCTGDASKSEVKEIQFEAKEIEAPVKADTMESLFSFAFAKDTVENGEEIKYHKNGAVHIRGMRKNSKRTGLWKSWYEDGTPWSETTFENGKKTGKTTTWYENGKKRYEGYYTNDVQSGKWTFWNEKGEVSDTKNMDLK